MEYKNKNALYLIMILIGLSCSNTASKNKKGEIQTQNMRILKTRIKTNKIFSKKSDTIKILKYHTFLNGLRYGNIPNQNLDLYIPKNNNLSLIVMVHGGSWIWGNNKPLTDFSTKLSNVGFNVININYRLCSKSKKISLDSQMVDLKHAIEYAKSYYYNLEQIKIIKTYLIGVSAGGNLVLLALQEHFIEPDGAIAISPPTLLEDSVFLNNMISNNLTFNYVVDQCFQKNELRKFTIQRNKLLETGIPILITHGTNDKIVPIKHSKYLVENSPANSNIKLVEFPFEGHNYTNTKDSLLKIILQFLKQK